MALSAYARGATDRLAKPVGRVLVAVGATPDGLTIAGLVVTVAGAAVVLADQLLAGALVLAFGAALDGLDGTVARLRGTVTRLGGFYDSVADRVGEAVVFAAVVWLVRDDPLVTILGVVVLAAGQLTSYVRAKAESLGWRCDVGLVERPERMLLILPAIAFGFLPLALWVLAAGSIITVIHRIVVVRRQGLADERAAGERA